MHAHYNTLFSNIVKLTANKSYQACKTEACLKWKNNTIKTNAQMTQIANTNILHGGK